MKSQYILNIKNIKEQDLELVGREALEIAFIIKEDVPIAPSFVLTSIAFDDFLTSAGIIEHIANSLKNVRPFIKQTARDASHEIQNYILSAKFSTILSEPIALAYQNLTINNDQPFVSMIPSNIIDQKFLSHNQNPYKDIIIKGSTDLLYYIKMSWLSLFTTEAIELRTNNYYKGALSTALIIQKMIRAVVSGKIYSVPPFTQEENRIEIRVVYGVEEVNLNTTYADLYKTSKDNIVLVEKNILPQNTMLVRKIKVEKGEDPNLKVEISDFWRKNQKIDDDKITKLAEIAKKIEKIFHTPVEINWGIEAGDIFILSMKELILSKISSPEEGHKEKIPQEKNIEKPKPNLKKLTEEVQAIIEEDTNQKDKKPQSKIDDATLHTKIEEDLPSLIRESNIVLPNIITQKDPTQGKFSYFEDFDFQTSIFIDISSMNSRLLSVLKYFSGSFVDGTEMILSNNVLPEELIGNNNKLNELIEKYSLDISTASKASVHKPMIYQFSTISEYELKLLGLEDARYKYNYDERFIDFPESMAVEAFALKRARNEYGARNLRLSFSGIRNLQNLDNLKKVVSNSGIKRSTMFKYYCEVAIPSFIFELDRLPSDQIDGVIISYTKLLKLTAFRTEIRDADNEVGIKELQILKKICLEKNLEYYIKLDNYSDELIKEVVNLNPTGIIFADIPKQETLEIIKQTENKNLNFKK